jgi:hypothetical protein
MERPLVSEFEYSKVVHIEESSRCSKVAGWEGSRRRFKIRRRKTSLRRALNEFIEHYHAERNLFACIWSTYNPGFRCWRK